MKMYLLAMPIMISISTATLAVETKIAMNASGTDKAMAVETTDHKVEMKNTGADGIMVFEPAVLRVNVGDTIHFMPTDMAHNSESIEGLTPKGSVTWQGAMNEAVSVTLDKEGVYVYQCLPHAPLAMVGVIVAGEPTNLAEIKEKAIDYSSRFATNKDRLDNYITSLQ